MFSDALVRSLVQHFADAAGLRRGVSVRVFTRHEQFTRHMARRGGLTKMDREHLRSGYAITFPRKHTPSEIYVNLERHVSLPELVDTAAHEVAHARFPHLRHGRLFDRRVTALLAGYTCGPKSERLPEPFR